MVSADVRRCVDTVAPVAEALGLEVELEPLLGEVAYPGREEEAVALVRHLGDVDEDAIACSQGDVIPDLVGRLATADGLALDEPIRSGKGSTWALTLEAEGHLVAADYLEPPRPAICGRRGVAQRSHRRSIAGARHLDPEGGPDALLGAQADRAAVGLGDVADDRQSETGTPAELARIPLACPRSVHLVEALEDALLVGLGDADPVVGDAEAHRAHRPAPSRCAPRRRDGCT